MASEARSLKFQLMVSPSEMAALDEYRWQHRLGSRAEALRRLVARGIAENENGPAAGATAPDQEPTNPR